MFIDFMVDLLIKHYNEQMVRTEEFVLTIARETSYGTEI